MVMTVTTDLDEVRRDVRSWVAENWSHGITVREWWRRLADAALSMPSWPVPYGRGYSSAAARVVTEELAAAGTVAPPQGAVGTTLAGPTLLEHGRPDQLERFLPPLLRGEEAWCQLFSEPGAGSDLAGLGARATRDGDEWIVNGQKVWNSSADLAQRAILLARTDPDVPKHAGITYFLLDMDQRGVEARPLRQMNGEAQFCEVFLTDARVAADAVLGGLGEGWRVAATTLRHERATTASRPAAGLVFVLSGTKAGQLDRPVADVLSVRQERRTFSGNAVPARKLIELARQRGVSAHPNLRQRLVGYYMLTEVNRLNQQRARVAAAAGQPVAGSANLTKLSISRICHTSREVAFAILGADTMLDGDDAPFGGDLQRVGLASFGTSIGGGTDEIQRNLLGERILGLPREPSTDRDVPYRQLAVGTTRAASPRSPS
jgi:alkylation response protein AidB-like acyl-CoA dehydrogenase